MILPPDLDPAAAIPRLTTALETGAVAVVLLQRASAAPPQAWQDALSLLLPVIRRYDIAFLLDGQPELAAAYDCDGVQISDFDAIRKTRKLIGPDRSLGFACGDSRHLAMEAGEEGVDYVAFDPDPEVLGWWAAVMTLPCVALPATDPAMMLALATSGAEFLALGSGFWADPRPDAVVINDILTLLASVPAAEA